MVGIGVLALAGYWIFYSLNSSKKVNNLELISQDAIFVLESYNAAQTWNEIAQSDFYPQLLNFPAFEKVSGQIVALDSITGSEGLIASELADIQSTISFHPVGKENFDLLFMINLRQGKARDLIESIEEQLVNGERFQNRTYSNREILELFDGDNDRKWSIAFLGDLILISESSFLVEESIRNYENGDQLTFARFYSPEELEKETNGRLLMSSMGVANLLRGIQGKTTDATIEKFEQYQMGFALDFDPQPGELSFRGNVNFQEEVNFTPSLESNINSIINVIPASTAAITQLNLNGVYETQKLKNRAFAQRETLEAQIEVELLSKGFLDTFLGELYLLKLEKIGPINENMSLITRSSNPEAVLELLKNYQNQEGEVVSDFYRQREIILVNEQDFLAHLFEGKFQGFNQTWLTAVGDILIFTNNQQSMKLMLDDIANGDTWGKSSTTSLMKNELSASSGFSKVVLFDKSWDSWTLASTATWSSFLQRYRSSFMQFYGLAFRLNQYPDRLSATLTFPYSKTNQVVRPNETKEVTLEPSQMVQFDGRLIFGPQAITNYQDRSQDVVVQDENNNLILLNEGGTVVYSVPLDGPVVSQAYQVDYYKNGKLQLLIATENSVYGIDRLGNPLPNYPFRLSGESITNLNLVDYSNTKAYRYFISTESGNLILMDKTGKLLDGWNPNRIGAPTIGNPRHVRAPRKGDYMMALSEPGNLHLFNRRGERKVSQPIRLGDGFNSPFVVFNNPQSNVMEIVNITQNGEIVRANFNGEITYTNQLVKKDRDSEFFIVPDQLENEFLIINKEFNEVKFLDSQEEEIFTVNSSSESLEIQFFNFGPNRRIITVTDMIQEYSYLYDFEGNLLTTLPLESNRKLDITFDSGNQQYIIRCVAGYLMREYTLAD